MDERVTVVVLVDSVDGALVLVVRPAGAGEALQLADAHRVFTVTLWLEDPETVRMSMRNQNSGSVAYVQGGPTLLAFARELGLSAAR